MRRTQITWLFLAAFELALLVLWVGLSTFKNRAAVPSAIVSFVGALLLCLLSYFEHLRSIRTSFLLNVYLLVTVVFDAARSRSYSLDPSLEVMSVLFTTRVGVKLFLAIFEARGKRSILLPEFADCPPEATAGVYSRALFWWQNSLFKKGFSNVLSVDDLFHLDKHLCSEHLHHIIQTSWDTCEYSSRLLLVSGPWLTIPLSAVSRRGSNSLFAVTLKRLKWDVLAVVPPRACLTAFNFCQPFLIHRAVTYSQQNDTDQTAHIGYGLIGAYVLVYVGIAVRSDHPSLCA